MRYPVSIDLHMHSTVSDGTDTPHEILCNAKKEGLELFSLTDHDAISGGLQILEELSGMERREDWPAFITGTEFTCKDELGKYHILGYRYDPGAEEINRVVNKGHSLRMEKLQKRLDFLKEAYGFAFSKEDTDVLMGMDNPGKPHIANMMVKYGYAASKDEAIYDYINKKKFANVYLEPKEAIEGILSSGGIPVLAHPSYGDGDQIIIGDELEERICRLMGFGLQGVEAFYSGFTPKLTAELLGIAKKYDLYITAGSDYHGTNKMIAIGSMEMPEPGAGPEGLYRFLRDVS